MLVETLNYFAEYREDIKAIAHSVVEAILINLEVEVIEQTTSLFLEGMDLYKARFDKGYSLTDCISMNVCRDRGINDILTHDDHFRQEGFNLLL